MIYHILNGDALKEKFPSELSGEVIVIPEVFMDGPVGLTYDLSFWNNRKKFIRQSFGEGDTVYEEKVMTQIARLDKIRKEDDVFLWFEDDLFCQCNLWFTVHYVSLKSQPQFFRVFPAIDTTRWIGFGRDGEKELKTLFSEAKKLNKEDTDHIIALWKAYVENDHARLLELAMDGCHAIRFEKEVIEAHLDRSGHGEKRNQPKYILSTLLESGIQTFPELFQTFSATHSIYGYGDLQVKNMLKEINPQMAD